MVISRNRYTANQFNAGDGIRTRERLRDRALNSKGKAIPLKWPIDIDFMG
jgi:hypothetical protein